MRASPARARASLDARARADAPNPSRARSSRARALPSDPYEAAQLVSVAGAVFALGAAALVASARGEPEPCAGCSGTGGDPCVFCDATGRRSAPAKGPSASGRALDGALGLARRNPYECTACKGAGIIMCRACRGSGYR